MFQLTCRVWKKVLCLINIPACTNAVYCIDMNDFMILLFTGKYKSES